MSLVDKYAPPQGGGVSGLWLKGTQATTSFMTSLGNAGNVLGDWGNALVYGGIVVIGGAVLMIAFSFVSGKQNIAEIAKVVKR
jgi:hypothetical protein